MAGYTHVMSARSSISALLTLVLMGYSPGTQRSTAYVATINKRNVLLLDTPGFDDSARENLEVLSEIVSQFYCFALRPNDVETRGVIFLHDISETRLGGSQKKTLGILKALVGGEHMGNVIVGTTMWSTTDSTKFRQEEQREQNLLGDQWNGIYKTTRVSQDDKDTAVQMINDLFTRSPIVLLSQKEMLQPPHTVENTTAGRLTMPEGHLGVAQLTREHKEHKKAFEEETLKRESKFQDQEEAAKQRFGEYTKGRGETNRKREEEKQNQNIEQGKLFEEETQRPSEEMGKAKRESSKREAKEKDEMRIIVEEQRNKFERERKARKGKARKEAEKRRKELEDLKNAINATKGPPKLDWFHQVVDVAVLWLLGRLSAGVANK